MSDESLSQQKSHEPEEQPSGRVKRVPLPGLKNLIEDKEAKTPVADDALLAEQAAGFWEDLKDSIPPWLDEIVAIALLIFGILSFLALFDTSGAVVAVAWSEIMTSLFGYGSLLVSAGLFVLGVVLLLPKVGIVVQFPLLRILAIEIAFLCILAIFHLAVNDVELRAVARAGQGGGLLGWGLSYPLQWAIGRVASIIFYSFLLFLSGAVLVGVRWRHIIGWLRGASTRLENWSKQLAQSAKPKAAPAEAEALTPQMLLSQRKNPLMRIRPNLDNLPPSLRSEVAAAVNNPPTNLPETTKDDDKPDLSDHPLFSGELAGGNLRAEFNAVGKMLGKKEGKQLVRRPDGRIKQYFTVSSMKETRRTGRREKILPSLDLLQDREMNLPEEEEINHNVVLIENTLLEFDIDIDVVDVQIGPTVTRYAVQPYKKDGKDEAVHDRTRLSKIASYASDLSLALSAKRLRLETPVPGTNYMGIEVPNKTPSVVALRAVYESQDYYNLRQKSSSPLLVPLGRDVSGKPVGIDLAKMPHLLIAGTTGSGKSVAIAAMAVSLVLNNGPEMVKMVMLDPKMVELSRFNGLPHLLGPVETDIERIIGVLRWCTREMDRRYKLLEEHAARNIDTYNARIGSRKRGAEPMPYIVIMIDEIGDLMMNRPEETEKTITRLAQMARAVGMHLVVATQRPSVDVITGLIKANFPGRISFAVASGVDSRVILDSVGAEHLLGQGDMLFLAQDAAGPRRVQGCYVSDEEVRAIIDHWRSWFVEQVKAGKLERNDTGPWERGVTRREFLAETDPMLEEAIQLVVDSREASASFIQRQLGLGYPRAARIMDMLEELGIIGEPVGGGRARRVLIQPGQDPFQKLLEQRMQEEER